MKGPCREFPGYQREMAIPRMNQFVAFVTALHVLAHSLFGCCSHVAQAHTGDALEICREAVCESERPKAHGHAENHGHAPAEPAFAEATQPNGCAVCEDESSDRHAPHDCQHAFCQWLGPDSTAAGKVLDLIHDLPAILFAAPGLKPSPASLLAAGENPNERAFALPLRLHLAVGVLLI
jgi:hypothetical protein